MCVCFYCMSFLYYLRNLFVFLGKNIDWRLLSMKLVVSIILYWIPSQSSLYQSILVVEHFGRGLYFVIKVFSYIKKFCWLDLKCSVMSYFYILLLDLYIFCWLNKVSSSNMFEFIFDPLHGIDRLEWVP